MQSTVAEDVLAGLVDHSQVDEPDSTRLSESYSPGSCPEIVWGPHQLVDIIRELFTGTECHIRTADGVSEDFWVKTGVRQGCVLSPLLFNCVMDKFLKEATNLLGGSLHI